MLCENNPLMKRDEARRVVLFTCVSGAQPAWSIHLKCCGVLPVLTSFHLACNVNYHNNFSVHGLKRIYYGGVPKYIQVGEHQFVKDKLAIHWMDLMLNA